MMNQRPHILIALMPGRMLLTLLAGFFLVAFSLHGRAECFELAEQHYGVSASLLRAVAEQESNMNPRAFNLNSNGSWDAGLMQINSRWLPLLKRHGIEARDLMDACTSVLIGAWILSNNFRRMGKTTQALGAYNSSHPQLRERYASQVLARLARAQRF
ncbi:MAG: lytic transglycosylase domain-containing protein [Methylobacillus glycogenes]|nr:lytic transglycosylase domain-containing protein [Methylobacillus glycogenes]